MQRSTIATHRYREHAIEALEIIGETLPMLKAARYLVGNHDWFVQRVDAETDMAFCCAGTMAIALANADDMEGSPALPDLDSLRLKLKQAKEWTTEAGIAAAVRNHKEHEELGDRLFGGGQ